MIRFNWNSIKKWQEEEYIKTQFPLHLNIHEFIVEPNQIFTFIVTDMIVHFSRAADNSPTLIEANAQFTHRVGAVDLYLDWMWRLWCSKLMKLLIYVTHIIAGAIDTFLTPLRTNKPLMRNKSAFHYFYSWKMCEQIIIILNKSFSKAMKSMRFKHNQHPVAVCWTIIVDLIFIGRFIPPFLH